MNTITFSTLLENNNKKELSKVSGIYRIVNTKTSKVYIGSAINLHRRFITHYDILKRNVHHSKHLQNSFNKYGKDVFEIDILQKCDKENLLFHEQKWIDLTKSYDRRLGYNINPVAGSNLGITSSKATRDKISEIQQFPILKYDLEGNFIEEIKSQKEASKILKCNPATIHGAIKGRKRSAKGFMWKKKLNDNFERKIDPYKQYLAYNSKKIKLTVEKNQIIFNSITELTKHLKISHCEVKRCLIGKTPKKLKSYKIELVN